MSLEKVFNTVENNRLPVFKVQQKKDDESSGNNPFNAPPKKEPKKRPNSLFEMDSKKKEFILKKNAFWIVILDSLLALIGKKQKWEETKLQLKLMQQRIARFEAVINSASSQKVLSNKNYRI